MDRYPFDLNKDEREEGTVPQQAPTPIANETPVEAAPPVVSGAPVEPVQPVREQAAPVAQPVGPQGQNGAYALHGSAVRQDSAETASGQRVDKHVVNETGSGYYGSYYNGPYYGAGGYTPQQPQRPAYQPYTPVPPVRPEGGEAAEKPKRAAGPNWAVFWASIILVALFAGFGGGFVANMHSGSGRDTVVYRSTEVEGTTGRNANVDSTSLSDIAAIAGESVVSITTENIVTNPFAGGEVQSGAGSGVIISQDGYIITNNHVIDGADNIVVTLPDGTDTEATLIGTDPTTDVAVIKIDAQGLIPAVLGDSSNVLVGDLCLAIGNPMGTLGGTVTDGIISALDREVTIDSNTMTLLQMSAAVSPGNSGGGLFNANAELIGIVNAKSNGDNSEGLGFAIPINTAMSVAQDLIDLGYVTGRPALGVTVRYISTAEQALQEGVSELGVYIFEVNANSAAEAAGVQPGDKVVSFGGTEIDSTTALTNAIKRYNVGDTVDIVVGRNGERHTLQVTLQEMTS